MKHNFTMFREWNNSSVQLNLLLLKLRQVIVVIDSHSHLTSIALWISYFCMKENIWNSVLFFFFFFALENLKFDYQVWNIINFWFSLLHWKILSDPEALHCILPVPISILQ